MAEGDYGWTLNPWPGHGPRNQIDQYTKAIAQRAGWPLCAARHVLPPHARITDTGGKGALLASSSANHATVVMTPFARDAKDRSPCATPYIAETPMHGAGHACTE
jgi:hypothetical protein